jgi:small-conductance mechanosensitive channel
MEHFIQEFQTDTAWLPAWLVSIGVLAAAFVVGLMMHRFAFRFLTRLVETRDLFWRSLVSRGKRPLRLGTLTFTLSFGATIAPLTIVQAEVIRHMLLLGFIAVLGWTTKNSLHIWMTVYLRRFKLDTEDNLLARTHVTQSRIVERIASFMIVAITIAAALMTFPAVQQYGVSLLASAGVAGIVLGLALQPVLKNVFAGIQLAVTQPIRIDDALLVEGRVGQCRGNHLHLCRGQTLGLAENDPAAQLFHRKPVSELDPRGIGADRHRHDLSRLFGAGVGDPLQGGGDRGSVEAVGQAGGFCSGHRFPRCRHGNPYPRLGLQCTEDLRYPLRSSRKNHRVRAARISVKPAAGESGRCCQRQ